MLDFQQKRKIRAVAYNRVTLAILFILILIMTRSTWIVYEKMRTSDQMKNVSVESVKELKTRNDELLSKIEKLKTQSGVEEEIRLKFNVVKAGENMVVIVNDEDAGTSTTTQNFSFWQKIKNLFR